MTEVGDIWKQAAMKWNEVSGQMQEADLDKSSNCPDWTVRELLDHAMHWQAAGGGALGAETTPGDEWASIEPALAAALADPANLEGTADAFGGMPNQGVAGLIIGDLLVHSWDLARSIGVDDTLPVGAVQATLMGLQRLPEKMLRTDTMFGPAIEMPEDASIQDQLLGFVGRQP